MSIHNPKTSDDLAEAKQLFFYYACNHFFMDHDGAGERYRKFSVSPAQEKEWRQEYIAFWLSKLSTDDLEPLDKLGDAWAHEVLPQLIALADKGDGYAKLWFANTIWQLTQSGETPRELIEQGRDLALNLWRSLVDKPVVLSQSHSEKITPLAQQALGASTPKEYITNYAKRKLAEYKTRGYLWQ